MRLKLFGYTLIISLQVLSKPQKYYLFVDDGRCAGHFYIIDISPDIAYLRRTAQAWLENMYGVTDTWETDNGRQFVHPLSPNAGKPGMGPVDAFISNTPGRD